MRIDIPEGLTFDDVLLKPAASAVLPHEVSTRTRVTRAIELGAPLISAAMDTVTEHQMAIAMAQAGGLGVIHKNMAAERQAEEVRRVEIAIGEFHPEPQIGEVHIVEGAVERPLRRFAFVGPVGGRAEHIRDEDGVARGVDPDGDGGYGLGAL